jgi:NTP pyrophosphatase (non-canonical NTP hydrolase)
MFQEKTFDAASHEHMKKELGDIMWYVIQACLALNIDLTDVIKANKEKLSQRFPRNQFNVKDSDNRKVGDI